MIHYIALVSRGILLLLVSTSLVATSALGQPPFWHQMFAVATTSNSIMGLSHQRCKYMKNGFDAEAISWYASGAIFHNQACWGQSKKFPSAINFCVFANLKQPPLCLPKAKDDFVDARDFHLPRGAFR